MRSGRSFSQLRINSDLALTAMADAMKLAPLNDRYRELEAEYRRKALAPPAIAR
jgi:hypothetical protein